MVSCDGPQDCVPYLEYCGPARDNCLVNMWWAGMISAGLLAFGFGCYFLVCCYCKDLVERRTDRQYQQLLDEGEEEHDS